MRRQWVEGGATAAAEAAAAAVKAGEGSRGGTPAATVTPTGAGISQRLGSTGNQQSIREGTIGTRHAKLIYYIKTQQGL
jgi:hypothetical protein